MKTKVITTEVVKKRYGESGIDISIEEAEQILAFANKLVNLVLTKHLPNYKEYMLNRWG